MTLSTFVGREKEFNKLNQILHDGSKKNGYIIFIEGEAGTGKSFFLKTLQERSTQVSGTNRSRFIYGYCYEDSGGQNAYQPFVEILATLLGKDNTRDNFTKLFLTIVKETGGDWLGMIPGVGPAISASLKTATIIAGQWLPQDGSKSSNQAESLSNQYVQSITRISEKYAPLVLMIEDAHWIDDASCRLLQRIGQKIGGLSLIIIVTCRPSYLTETHPLWRARNEILAKNQGEVLSLSGLNEKEVEEYIIRRFGNSLHPKLTDWLIYLCKGNPFFLTQYLSLLEQEQVIRSTEDKFLLDGGIRFVASDWELNGRLADISIPRNINALLEQRIKRLVEEDQEMLQLGAVQGELFMSSILADLLDKKEMDILRRLRKVIEQHKLINLYTGNDLNKSRTEIYTFEHALLQQTLYNKLSPRERILYHRSIAEQLANMIKNESSPSRKLLLDTAHHYDLGQEHELAAEYYYQASQSLLADGANVEAIEIAERALQNINQVPGAYSLLSKISIQLLIASTHRIYNQDGEKESIPFSFLIENAKKAATLAGEKESLIQIKYLEGVIQYTLNGLSQAVKIYGEVLDQIKEVQNPISKYVLLSHIGHHICGENLKDGLDLQYKAQNIFKTDVLTSYSEIPKNLTQYYYTAQFRIGVGEFDLGNYGEAHSLLEESVIELRKNHFTDDLVWALNFLAQLYIATGAFQEAESAITEALALDQENDEPTSCYGYNLTLLGKLYLEWNRISEAYDPMRKGMEESLRAQTKWELPLARNYYSELLMHPDYKGRNLDEAVQQLDLNIAETQQSKFHRSLVAALSLRGIAALAQQQLDVALDYSTQAVAYLQRMGTLPALRTEEVLFNHYQILMSNGKSEEAQIYLAQAYEVLVQKAKSIRNPAYYKSFMEQVNLSREITKEMKIA